MSNTEIFVVLISAGQYEDHGLTIDAVFDSKELAEKHSGFIAAHFNELKDAEPPFPEQDYFDNTLTKEQDDKFSLWQSNKWAGQEFNCTYIEEHTINSVLKSVINQNQTP